MPLRMLMHLMWMCKNMPDPTIHISKDRKWNRWLGFIQGTLVSNNLASIEEMKLANKEGLSQGLTYCWCEIAEALAAKLECSYGEAQKYAIRWEEDECH